MQKPHYDVNFRHMMHFIQFRAFHLQVMPRLVGEKAIPATYVTIETNELYSQQKQTAGAL